MQLLSGSLEEAFLAATHVVGIGAAKAGTTWLHDYLARHPQVCQSTIKELHYFDARYLPGLCGYNNAKNLRRYRETGRGEFFMRLAMLNDERVYRDYFRLLYQGEPVYAEISPSYSMLDRDVFRRMDSIHPQTKYVFLVRNPVDQVWSLINFFADVTGDGFEESQAAFESHDPRYWLRADYGRTLRELTAAVGSEQVLVLCYEQLFCDDSIKRLCDFLGLEFRSGNYERKVNKTDKKRIDAQTRQRYATMLRPVYDYMNDFFGGDLPDVWKDDLRLAHARKAMPISHTVQPSIQGDISIQRDAEFVFDESNPAALCAMADLFMRKGEEREAAGLLDQVVQQKDCLARALELRGALFEAAGDLEGAVRMVERQAEREPQEAAHFLRLGALQEKQGDTLGATKAFEAAAKSDVDSPWPLYRLSCCFEQSGRQEEAVAMARRAMEKQPENPDFLLHLGKLLIAAAMLDEAEAVLNEAVRVAPTLPGAWYTLSRLHVQRDNGRKALECARKAVELKGAPHLKQHLHRLKRTFGNSC